MDLKVQYDKLLRYCYMKTKDRFTAEDIVQETFLKLWKSHTYEDTGKEMAYLYTIARNLCMDEFRRRKDVDIDDYTELLECRNSQSDSIIESLAITEALEKLPEELKEIITLRYISDMSSADIGKVMNLSRFSVNRRLKEGLKLLKKYMEGEDEDDR
ncbi:MAG: sigma-70 family RNA polymerase sigma factor [Eubacteriales bacterium]|nr:sigma-70 family RNA polymerase sigma factor [Eubacteriales bacterium]